MAMLTICPTSVLPLPDLPTLGSLHAGLRKSAAVHLPPTALVTLTACLDAVLSCTGVAVAGGFKGAVFQAKDRWARTAEGQQGMRGVAP